MHHNEYNPLKEFEFIAKEIGKVFSDIDRKDSKESENDAMPYKPIADILEDNGKVYFEIELPGVQKENVKLSISDEGILTVAGNKGRDLPQDVKVCCKKERKFGEFRRAFKLPDDIDSAKVSAKFNSGVLYISVDRKIEVMPKENVINID